MHACILVTLSILAMPTAAINQQLNDGIFSEGKAVLWCKGRYYSGPAQVSTMMPNQIGFLADLDGVCSLQWTQTCRFKVFTMTIVTSSTPSGLSEMPELKFVMVFVCGDSVTLCAFGWGCFLYFKGTATQGSFL